MKAKQRRSYKFDARSVMLFAALSLGAAGVMHAQAASSAPTFGPADKAAAPTSSPYSIGPAAAKPSVTAAAAAFDRADANKDGQLNAQEAKQLPAISQRFKQLDTDNSGSLSRTEFDKGAHS